MTQHSSPYAASCDCFACVHCTKYYSDFTINYSLTTAANPQECAVVMLQ